MILRNVTRSATVQNTLTIYIISVKRHSITGQHLSTFILTHGDLPICFSAICTLFPLVILGRCRCRLGFFDVEVHAKERISVLLRRFYLGSAALHLHLARVNLLTSKPRQP